MFAIFKIKEDFISSHLGKINIVMVFDFGRVLGGSIDISILNGNVNGECDIWVIEIWDFHLGNSFESGISFKSLDYFLSALLDFGFEEFRCVVE